MGKVWHFPRLLKTESFQCSQTGFHTAAHRPGGGGAEDAQHLPGIRGGCICRAGIKARPKAHLNLCRLGGLVQGDIGGIVAVRGNQAQARIAFRRPQRLTQIGRGGGQVLHRQYIHRNHTLSSVCRPTPDTFFFKIMSINSATYAPASTAGVPWAWILLTTVREDSDTPVWGL